MSINRRIINIHKNKTKTYNKIIEETVNTTMYDVINGGIGIYSYEIGDIITADEIQHLTTIEAKSAGYVLTSNGINTKPSYEKLNLTTSITGILDVSNGGTNITSYTIGDLIYASGTTTLSQLNDIATGNVLLSGGIGIAPSYGKVNLGIMISGILASSNGGTDNSTYTIGDILYATGTTTLSKLSDIATGNVLLSGGVGVAPSYGKVNLGTTVTGILGATSGGIGLNSYLVGDLVTASNATTLARLADIATGNVLISAGTSTQPNYGKVNLSVNTPIIGVLPSTNGGTDNSSYTTGDILYATSTTTIGKLSNPGTGNVLLSGGVGSLPVYGKVDLTIHVSGTTLTVNGGTGISSYAVGDLIYASGTTTINKLADIATGNALISGGVNIAPSYGKVGMTTHVTGVLPITNGGTNLNAVSAGYSTSTGTSLAVVPFGTGTYMFTTDSGGTGFTTVRFPKRIAQIITTSTGALITCSTTIPADNTVPQSTEGNLVLQITISPLASTSTLYFYVHVNGGNNTTGSTVLALFSSSSGSAMACNVITTLNGVRCNGNLFYTIAAGSTTSRTYTLRCGSAAGNVYYINGTAGGLVRFGGASNTYFKIIEVS